MLFQHDRGTPTAIMRLRAGRQWPGKPQKGGQCSPNAISGPGNWDRCCAVVPTYRYDNFQRYNYKANAADLAPKVKHLHCIEVRRLKIATAFCGLSLLFSTVQAKSLPTPILPGTTWYWQLSGKAIISHGAATLYDIDLEKSSPALIKRLQDAGHMVICYFSAGGDEPRRSAAGRCQQWLRIASSALSPLLEIRSGAAPPRWAGW